MALDIVSGARCGGITTRIQDDIKISIKDEGKGEEVSNRDDNQEEEKKMMEQKMMKVVIRKKKRGWDQNPKFSRITTVGNTYSQSWTYPVRYYVKVIKKRIPKKKIIPKFDGVSESSNYMSKDPPRHVIAQVKPYSKVFGFRYIREISVP